MEGYIVIFIAVFILLSKIISDLFSRINLPPVLGMILIGLIAGPTGFNLIKSPEDFNMLHFFAQIGVILLLFMAGMETDIQQMKQVGKNALIIALSGVFVPLLLGFGVSMLFYHDSANAVMSSLMLGIISTATSVSVTVMTLMQMKRMKTVEGNTILGAAIIDDVIGIILLTLVLGVAGSGAGEKVAEHSLLATIGLIIGFITGGILFGVFVLPWILNLASKLRVEKPVIAIGLALTLIYAWLAEQAGVAAITGAYLAGLFIGQTRHKKRIEEGMVIIGQAVFISIFFVFIGLETNLRGQINWWFAIAFTAAAIISKLLGAGFSARALGFDWRRAMRIGSGMVPRGEVGLVIATMVASSAGIIGHETNAGSGKIALLNNEQFTAVVFMVIITAFLTPFLLKIFFKESTTNGPGGSNAE